MYLCTLRAPAAVLEDDSDGGDKSSVLVKLDVEVAGEFWKVTRINFRTILCK